MFPYMIKILAILKKMTVIIYFLMIGQILIGLLQVNLMKIKNFGAKSAKEVIEKLKEYKLLLKESGAQAGGKSEAQQREQEAKQAYRSKDRIAKKHSDIAFASREGRDHCHEGEGSKENGGADHNAFKIRRYCFKKESFFNIKGQGPC